MLSPAALLETVTVTPTRTEQRLGDIPASVNVVDERGDQASPALVADDVLRQVPTFSLFRRTSSLVAHPTTQGVSLRGIGPSGQSRTLVLLDGVPFNDPFGGWVYWTRVPLESVDRIEMVDGLESSLYGNYAMGGVINIVTSRPTRRTVELKPQYGSHEQPEVRLLRQRRVEQGGRRRRRQLLQHRRVPDRRGHRARADRQQRRRRYQNMTVKVEYTPTDRLNMFFRAGYFTEERVNGKVGEVNDTRWTTRQRRRPRAAARRQRPRGARCSSTIEKSHFNFLAVTNPATTRNVVRLATDQHVPTSGVGGMVQWTKALGRTHVFSAGIDWRWVDGDSQEDGFVAAVRRDRRRHAGGDADRPARFRRHAAEHRRVRAGHFHATQAGR